MSPRPHNQERGTLGRAMDRDRMEDVKKAQKRQNKSEANLIPSPTKL
jgi:hypothetical protein